MAINTVSDWGAGVNIIAPYRYARVAGSKDSCIGTLFGMPLPSNVTHAEVGINARAIMWKVEGSNASHSMGLPDDVTTDYIQAIFAAMRISC